MFKNQLKLNSKKKILVIKKKEKENNQYDAAMKNSIKNTNRSIDKKDKKQAEANLKIAIKAIDKATKHGSIKKNKASRNKSKLTKKVNEMK